jgi:type II secretory pathway pseudopilin PulG
MNRGHTLVELTAVLLLMALASSTLLPLARRTQDRSSVVAAREAVAGLVAEARVASVMFGGASVHFAAEPWRAWYEAGGEVRRRVPLGDELGVTLVLTRSRTAAEIRFDALGLGQIASESLRFVRRDADAGLVLSSYGRVRRW